MADGDGPEQVGVGDACPRQQVKGVRSELGQTRGADGSGQDAVLTAAGSDEDDGFAVTRRTEGEIRRMRDVRGRGVIQDQAGAIGIAGDSDRIGTAQRDTAHTQRLQGVGRVGGQRLGTRDVHDGTGRSALDSGGVILDTGRRSRAGVESDDAVGRVVAQEGLEGLLDHPGSDHAALRTRRSRKGRRRAGAAHREDLDRRIIARRRAAAEKGRPGRTGESQSTVEITDKIGDRDDAIGIRPSGAIADEVDDVAARGGVGADGLGCDRRSRAGNQQLEGRAATCVERRVAHEAVVGRASGQGRARKVELEDRRGADRYAVDVDRTIADLAGQGLIRSIGSVVGAEKDERAGAEDIGLTSRPSLQARAAIDHQGPGEIGIGTVEDERTLLVG